MAFCTDHVGLYDCSCGVRRDSDTLGACPRSRTPPFGGAGYRSLGGMQVRYSLWNECGCPCRVWAAQNPFEIRAIFEEPWTGTPDVTVWANSSKCVGDRLGGEPRVSSIGILESRSGFLVLGNRIRHDYARFAHLPCPLDVTSAKVRSFSIQAPGSITHEHNNQYSMRGRCLISTTVVMDVFQVSTVNGMDALSYLIFSTSLGNKWITR